jgi:deoxyribonuclease-4
MLIGPHVSIAGGLLGAAQEAAGYGATTFMAYTGAPQNSKRVAVDKLKIGEGRLFMAANGLGRFVVHAPYIINMASPNEETYAFAKRFMKEELARAEAMGAELLVVHPGAYTDSCLDDGIGRIISALDEVTADGDGVCVCLELMAGKGTEIGRDFNELARIINGTKNAGRLGVCFDTCHAHDGGYDIIEGFDGVMKEFDDIIGLDRLRCLHLNGSLNGRGARKDRHANIGAGEDNLKGADKIGLEAILNIAHSPYAEGRFLILETPWLDDYTNLYKEEIKKIKKL